MSNDLGPLLTSRPGPRGAALPRVGPWPCACFVIIICACHLYIVHEDAHASPRRLQGIAQPLTRRLTTVKQRPAQHLEGVIRSALQRRERAQHHIQQLIKINHHALAIAVVEISSVVATLRKSSSDELYNLDVQ